MTDKLYNPDYLLMLCKKYELQPSKKYGQNYLINPEVIEKIIEAGMIDKNDQVVEIGPGFGVLTFALVEKAKKVIAFEIEKKLQIYWQERAQKNLQLVWGNVLYQLENLPKNTYKLVANLPYQITSSIIRAFLESIHQPSLMVLMVQKEVAERICAKPGDMSVLSLSVQYYAEPKIITNVSKDNFWPMPKVDSAILLLTIVPRDNSEVKVKKLFQLIKIGFASKRKKLIKNILPLIGKENKNRLEAVLSELGYSKDVRAQELAIGDWERLLEIVL